MVKQFKKAINKVKQEFQQEPKLFIVIFAFIFAVLFFSGFYVLTDTQFNWQTNVMHLGPRLNRSLDGKLVALKKTNLKPIAVILENYVESRPVAGLENASIVYETIVEGDITRFLAIFDGDIKAKRIGPVRSVRPFFVDILKDWNPVLFHAGGSAAGLAQLKNSPVFNVNEISGDGIYFWREPNRQPPHNLFTSANLIAKALAAKEVEAAADFSPWLFKADEPKAEPDASSDFEVNFSSNPLYQVEYKYNPKTNDYTRYLAGNIHKTERGIILKAKNVVVQQVDFNIIDSYGRLTIDLASGGNARVYQDGKTVEGVWRTSHGKTRFFNQDNKEIRFNRGVIWISLVFQ